VLLHRVIPALGVLLSLVLATATAAQTPNPASGDVRFTALRPFGIGDVDAVEFRDAAGTRTRLVKKSFEVSKQDGRQHVEEVSFLTAARYVLVTESTRTETDTATRQATGRLLDSTNTITLYDRFGRALFTKQVECTPVALSENGRTVCLLTALEYWEGPPDPQRLSPATDHLTVFSRRGAVLDEVDETRWTVKNVRISPAGNWVAYAKELGGLSNQIVLRDLRTHRRVETPQTEQRELTGFRAVTNKGDLLAFQETATKHADGTWTMERSPSRLLYRAAPR
jgi:hypothetical protein